MARSVKQAKKGSSLLEGDLLSELNWPSLEAKQGLETREIVFGMCVRYRLLVRRDAFC